MLFMTFQLLVWAEIQEVNASTVIRARARALRLGEAAVWEVKEPT